jgi:hypothetical protein
VVRSDDKVGGLRAVAALAVFIAATLPLAACTSTGSSSFSTASLKPAVDQTGSVQSADAVTDEAAAAQQSPQGRELAYPAGNREMLADATSLERSLKNAQATQQDRRIELASLAAEGEVLAAGARSQLAYADDPVERAAEQRIAALYPRISHGECKGGWGPKPLMINAKRIDPAHPYYMEMRLRHTPPLPIGHVYIAYGHIDAAGEPVDEKLVMLSPIGGYAGAAVASAIPMPGLLTPHPDDCVVKPIAAYRVSLSAQQYEQLLLEIERQKEKKPAYSLFAYNCNMFMSDVAESVGILPPKNIYNPSLVYFYEMMDRNEGRKVPRAPGADVEMAQAKPLQQPLN